jgi:hypothetical protein
VTGIQASAVFPVQRSYNQRSYKMQNVVKTALVLLLIILSCALVGEDVSAAVLPAKVRPLPAQVPTIPAPRVHYDVDGIIRVLERRIGSHRLPEEAKEKLERMPAKDLRLVALLCERLETANTGAGTDLALLLAAVLIVLS